MTSTRRRFWVEIGAASVTTLLAVVTARWPNWIERIAEVEPDAGSGELEWALVAVFALTTLALLVAARLEWVRGRRLATG